MTREESAILSARYRLACAGYAVVGSRRGWGPWGTWHVSATGAARTFEADARTLLVAMYRLCSDVDAADAREAAE